MRNIKSENLLPTIDLAKQILLGLIFILIFDFLLFPLEIDFWIFAAILAVPLLVYFVAIPLVKITKTVGHNVNGIVSEFLVEYKNKTRLGKIKVAASIALGIAAIINLIIDFI